MTDIASVGHRISTWCCSGCVCEMVASRSCGVRADVAARADLCVDHLTSLRDSTHEYRGNFKLVSERSVSQFCLMAIVY